MYSSSRLTFLFRYVLPIIMTMIVLTANFLLWTQKGVEHGMFTWTVSLATIWIFLVQFPYRLRFVKADGQGVHISTRDGERLIPYSEMHWVTKFDLTCPWFMTIKYQDEDTGSSRKIAFIPKNRFQKLVSQDDMTEFIRDNIQRHSKYYDPQSEPSAKKNFVRLFLLGSPFLLLILYFLRQGYLVLMSGY